MRFFRRVRTESSSQDTIFLNDHPLPRTHSIGKYRADVVPVVTGTRMPYVNDSSPMDMVVKRYKVSMVLFKPFRASADLVTDYRNDNAWRNAYSEWEPTRSGFVKEILENMDDYFRAQEQTALAKEMTEMNMLKAVTKMNLTTRSMVVTISIYS
ncbi:hypothetical protein JG688_00017467 [Phytophthora aleatoria]|uniref:Uncharacterized protein n=1 Tax=Phytophthora aleatoria TaxID=2496075 RepID=A0A8J5M1B0_9STRA|nr:hypothetical protein JG688_00017467 [Phytophthora aleatoria]